jgi:DNA repair protein RecO (recombination protein O)
MKQLTTEAIILSRIDYGEADRILTLLTPHYGKLSLLARGVRRVKSKLAGGIELFSVSEITFIQGRGAMGTLVSTRLAKHYDAIVKDLDRTMLGYELIKQLNKITEDEPEESYFDLLRDAFEALNDPIIPLPLVRFWFSAQLLRWSGHTPNLQTDSTGNSLVATQRYEFNTESMSFTLTEQGRFTADHVKLLRLAFAGNKPAALVNIRGTGQLVTDVQSLLQRLVQLAYW